MRQAFAKSRQSRTNYDHVIVYYPKTEEGKRELARRVADVHADVVHQAIQKLNCPSAQKLELLDAVIATAKKEAGEQTR